jgi:hypothetical protein
MNGAGADGGEVGACIRGSNQPDLKVFVDDGPTRQRILGTQLEKPHLLFTLRRESAKRVITYSPKTNLTKDFGVNSRKTLPH